MLVDVYKINGAPSGEKLELADDIFGIEPNDHVIYLSVKAFLANQRQGTHKSKERGEIRGGGKKPWKQKGKGGARAGTTRSPLWVGGGRIFGPKPRDYRQDLPKKVNALARRSALSYKVKDEQILVVEDLNFTEAKTKTFNELLSNLKLDGKKVLLLTGDHKSNVYLSARNLPKARVLQASNASTYDLLNNQILVLEKSAAEAINKLLKKEKTLVG